MVINHGLTVMVAPNAIAIMFANGEPSPLRTSPPRVRTKSMKLIPTRIPEAMVKMAAMEIAKREFQRFRLS